MEEPEHYQERAEAMYPEADYQQEKFWNDISLGLSLISGRSEGGRWAPIVEDSLTKWIEGGKPIREAERARGAQVAATADQMREEDVDNFRDMMGTYMMADWTAQLSQGLEQFKILTKEEAEAENLPTDDGQIYRKNLMNSDITFLQAMVPAKDKFRILSTAEADLQGLDTSMGQVWEINEKTNKRTQIVGMNLAPNWVVLNKEEAKIAGLPVDNGQVWSRNKTNNETKQLYGIDQLPSTWTTLSVEQAKTLVGPETYQEGEVYQRNNLTKKVELLKGFKTPSDDWIVLSDDEAADEPTPLPTDNGQIWMKNRKNGNVKQLLAGPIATARDDKIADMIQILRDNEWAVTTVEGKTTLPTNEEVKNHAVKLVDGEIQLIPQPDGRIFSLDTTTNELIMITGDHKGEYPYIGQIRPEHVITQMVDGVETEVTAPNPYAIEMDPPQQVLMELPPGVVEQINERIQHLSWAHIVATDIETRLKEVIGPQGWFKSALTGTFAILPEGMDQWATFIGTERGKQQMELFTRAMIQALALNPRFPVAEQEMIKDIVPEGTKFWQDPKVAFVRFNEMMRYIQNALAYERASLQIERTPWYTLGAIPSGTTHDPVKLYDERDEMYFNQMSPEQKKGMMLMWEPGGKVAPSK